MVSFEIVSSGRHLIATQPPFARPVYVGYILQTETLVWLRGKWNWVWNKSMVSTGCSHLNHLDRFPVSAGPTEPIGGSSVCAKSWMIPWITKLPAPSRFGLPDPAAANTGNFLPRLSFRVLQRDLLEGHAGDLFGVVKCKRHLDVPELPSQGVNQ